MNCKVSFQQIKELISELPVSIKEPNELSQDINLLLDLNIKIEQHQNPLRFKEVLIWSIEIIKRYIILNLKLRYKLLEESLKKYQNLFDDLKESIKKREKIDNQKLSDGISLERQISSIYDNQKENLSKQQYCQQIKNMKEIQIFIKDNQIT